MDGSFTREQEGTGLGLALVYKLTELHGGSILIASEKGKYSRFTVMLPWIDIKEFRDSDKNLRGFDMTDLRGFDATDLRGFLRTSEASKTSEIPQQNLGGQIHTHKARILIVDDNMSNVKTVADYLETKSYDLLLAYDGSEAVKLAIEKKPDLIIMDIQMPVMDGLEAIKVIRNFKDENPETASKIRKIPIIALTALAMTGDREKCLEAGANIYLSKPVGLKMLADMIEELMAGA